MNLPNDEQLQAVATDTLATMAFLFPAEDQPEGQGAGGSDSAERTVCTVSFAGPRRGLLAISVDSSMLEEIASNLLGLDSQPPSEGQKIDATKELLNVICGNLLPAVFSPQDVFDVGAPAVVQTMPQSAPYQPAGRVRLAMETGGVELALWVDQPKSSDNSNANSNAQDRRLVV